MISRIDEICGGGSNGDTHFHCRWLWESERVSLEYVGKGELHETDMQTIELFQQMS